MAAPAAMYEAPDASNQENIPMTQAYSDPSRESDPHALPNIEVFQLTAHEVAALDEDTMYEYAKRQEFQTAFMSGRTMDAMLDAIVAEEGITGGWFWQACFPGCLPDGPPMGPFDNYAAALADAQDDAL
jgi:hypothetical protein